MKFLNFFGLNTIKLYQYLNGKYKSLGKHFKNNLNYTPK